MTLAGIFGSVYDEITAKQDVCFSESAEGAGQLIEADYNHCAPDDALPRCAPRSV
jgi:hypothetical protein